MMLDLGCVLWILADLKHMSSSLPAPDGRGGAVQPTSQHTLVQRGCLALQRGDAHVSRLPFGTGCTRCTLSSVTWFTSVTSGAG